MARRQSTHSTQRLNKRTSLNTSLITLVRLQHCKSRAIVDFLQVAKKVTGQKFVNPYPCSLPRVPCLIKAWQAIGLGFTVPAYLILWGEGFSTAPQ